MSEKAAAPKVKSIDEQIAEAEAALATLKAKKAESDDAAKPENNQPKAKSGHRVVMVLDGDRQFHKWHELPDGPHQRTIDVDGKPYHAVSVSGSTWAYAPENR